MTPEEREEFIRMQERQRQSDRLLAELLTEVKEMRKDFTRAKGVYAGIVMAVSVVWAGVLAFWSWLSK